MINERLSKKEYKYRNKIICEYHLNKEAQKMIDDFVSKNTTYQKLYFDKTALAFRMVSIRIKKFQDNVASFGVSVKEAEDGFRKLADVIHDCNDLYSKSNKGEILYE